MSIEDRRVSIVVPTRNRSELLLGLLKNLDQYSAQLVREVIIVDSSDNFLTFEGFSDFKITHLRSKNRSAAIQRNEGLDYLRAKSNRSIEILSFLDDDVRIGSGYIESIIDFFENNPEVIGYSGVTKESKPNSCSLPKKIFGFCSLPGQISRGGINNPVGPFTKPILRQCAWLIGCSNWRYKAIENLRFESDFYGSSLYEDVIFSHSATKLGKLVTNSELLLSHLQSSLERENSYLYSQKIIINRYRIFTKFPNEFHMLNFWVASFGFLLRNIVQFILNPNKQNLGKLTGTASGIRNLIRS